MAIDNYPLKSHSNPIAKGLLNHYFQGSLRHRWLTVDGPKVLINGWLSICACRASTHMFTLCFDSKSCTNIENIFLSIINLKLGISCLTKIYYQNEIAHKVYCECICVTDKYTLFTCNHVS